MIQFILRSVSSNYSGKFCFLWYVLFMAVPAKSTIMVEKSAERQLTDNEGELLNRHECDMQQKSLFLPE